MQSVLQPMRVNPRQRMLHALFRTSLDVMHIQRDEQGHLFTVAAQKEAKQAAEAREQEADRAELVSV